MKSTVLPRWIGTDSYSIDRDKTANFIMLDPPWSVRWCAKHGYLWRFTALKTGLASRCLNLLIIMELIFQLWHRPFNMSCVVNLCCRGNHVDFMLQPEVLIFQLWHRTLNVSWFVNSHCRGNHVDFMSQPEVLIFQLWHRPFNVSCVVNSRCRGNHVDFMLQPEVLFHLIVGNVLILCFSLKFWANLPGIMAAAISKYPGCPVVVMDSHLPLYRRYINLEKLYGFVTKQDPKKQLYPEQKYLSEWEGREQFMHPGRVVTRHYANILLNYICSKHKEIQTWKKGPTVIGYNERTVAEVRSFEQLMRLFQSHHKNSRDN